MIQTKKSQNQQKRVINQLIVKSPRRNSSSIGKWRNALQAADRGRVKLLYDLYQDLEIDGVLSNATDKRISAVLNSKLVFQNQKGKGVKAITQLIDTPDFEVLLSQILQTKFWGRSAVEFDFTEGFSVWEIPKKHINLQSRQILREENDSEGIPYEGDDLLFVLGEKNDFGLYLKTAPFAIWKRGGFGDYAQWIELFGMPQRIGQYNSYDPDTKRLLEEAMEKYGAAPWLIAPKEAEIKTEISTGSSNGVSFNDFRKACNQEISTTILGAPMPSKQTQNLYDQLVEEKHKSDKRFVQKILNFYIIPILQKRGFPVQKGKFRFQDPSPPLSLSDTKLLADFINIPATYLHQKYNIPSVKAKQPLVTKKQKNNNN